jgi:Flp pilus assembly pilin Flp
MRLSERLRALRDDAGQTFAEYGVVLSVITILTVVALGALGVQISTIIDGVTALVP